MTCLEDTFWFVLEQPHKFNIVHAIVQRRSDGKRHPHAVAYNKETGNIHEVSNIYKNNNVVIPFRLWIVLGKVSNIKQYTSNEYRKLLLKHERWDFFHIPIEL
jgi:hypothetical protein